MKDCEGKEDENDDYPEQKRITAAGYAEGVYGEICGDPFEVVGVRRGRWVGRKSCRRGRRHVGSPRLTTYYREDSWGQP